MKKFLFIVCLTVFFFFIPKDIRAQQGCCSYHGGVCGCSGISKLCCDGTLSPSCTCGYIPSYYYNPQPPKAPDVTASFTYKPNNDGNTFDVFMDWSDVTSTGYSIALQQFAGGNPGPLTDTYSSEWTFHDIYPGIYYANMKVSVNYIGLL